MKRFLMSLVVLTAGCGTLHADYVQADRDTYEAFHERIILWIDGDETMDEDLKDDYRGLDASWDARITAAEQHLAEEDAEEAPSE